MSAPHVPLRLLVVTFTVCGLASGARVQAGEWSSDVEAARKTSRKEERPLLLHFYADWCGPCRLMERNVLRSKQLAERLGARIVAAKVNADRRQDLVRRYGVRVLPSDVLLGPDGRVLARSEGGKSRSAYMAWLGTAEEEFRSARVARNDTATPDGGEPENEAEQAASGDVPVGLDGYSPVALKTSREWVRGDEEFAATHEEIVYHMANQEELEQFRRNPRKYAPQLLGCDPVVLYESDRAVRGSLKWGAFFDGELYLFQSPETRREFREQPYRYTRTRHVLRPEQIEGPLLR